MHSALLSTFIKLPFVIKIFVSSIFEWPFDTGFTVYLFEPEYQYLVSNVFMLFWLALKMMTFSSFELKELDENCFSLGGIFLPTKMITVFYISRILLTIRRRCFFCGSLLLFVFCVFLSYCLVCPLQPFGPHAGLGLTSWLICMLFFLVFCHFPLWCLVSGVVYECIDS